MLAISWKVRGLGCLEKICAMRSLSQKYKPQFLFLEEIKLQDSGNRVIERLWGRGDCSWVVANLLGASKGLISIWSNIFFEVDCRMTNRRYVLIIGKLKLYNVECGLVNLYAPNDEGERQEFRDELLNILSSRNIVWCIGGDLNAVRIVEERSG